MTVDRELPSGWTIATIGELATYQNGRAFKPSEWSTSGLPIIRIQNLNDNSAAYNYSKDRHEERFKVKHGDLLFAWSASLGAHIWRGEDAWLNQHIFRVDHARQVDRRFLFYALAHITRALYSRAHGSGMIHVTKGTFENTELGLPPYEEQRRIAEKIDELVSDLDAAMENLSKVIDQLVTFRKAVLKRALEGGFTGWWRDGNREQMVAPEQLVARISRARVERYERKTTDWRSAIDEAKERAGVERRSRRPSLLSSLLPFPESGADGLPKLPAGWAYVRLGLLIDEPKYGTSKKCHHHFEGTGVLRIPNIVDGVISTDDLKGAYFDDEEVRVFSLTKGDILMIRSNGSISLVGKSAIVSKADEEYLYAGYLMRLRSNRDVIIPEYLILAIESHFVRMQIEQKAKSTSGVNNINAREVQSLVIPLCSVNEQRVIIELLLKPMSAIDGLGQEVKDQLSTSEALRRAILDEAISGNLVPQDPSDEPASDLLNRIRAERMQIIKNTSRRKKTKVRF